MTSTTNLADDALTARLRDKLNGEKIQLWLDPFFNETTKQVNDSEILALASRYSMDLNVPGDEVAESLYNLQRNSIERITERENFNVTGMATLRLKFSGFSALNSTVLQSEAAQKIQIDLKTKTGLDLKTAIAQQISLPEIKIKLICQGRVIADMKTLESQNIKNSSRIMVLCLFGDAESIRQDEEDLRSIEETKESANYLATKDLNAEFSLQIADQSGKALNLPQEEKRTLVIALTLHEKGRGSMKLNEYSKALIYLLEADGIYNQCNSELLEVVDNYGLLNLDIAWCYLSLQSINELPSIEQRLSKCEKVLRRSYGEDFQRVLLLKGSTGSEAALIVRLQLLQGIAAYHMGQIEKSKFFMSKVETQLNQLKVEDDKMAELINMGYSESEARMALRATYGNIESAVNWIITSREKTKENKKQEHEDKKDLKLQQKLGKCENGDPVNIGLWKSMREMGFNPFLVKEALKVTNNEINEAVHLVSDNEFITSTVKKMMNVVAESASNNPSTSTTDTDVPMPMASASSSSDNTEEPAAAVVQAQQIISAAAAANPDISSALFELGRVFSESSLLPSPERLADAIRSQKAYENVAKGLNSEADYIDLTLSPETEYFNHYKALLRI